MEKFITCEISGLLALEVEHVLTIHADGKREISIESEWSYLKAVCDYLDANGFIENNQRFTINSTEVNYIINF